MQFIPLLLLMMIMSTAHALEQKQASTINLEQVVVRVLESNPQLSANDYRAQSIAASIRQAQQTTPLRLKLDVENFAGSGRYDGSDELEASLSLIKLLETGGKVRKRGKLAEQQGELLRNQQDGQRLDILTEAANQFIHVMVDQMRLKISHGHKALLQQTYDVVSRRVSAGTSHIAEQRRISIDLARADVEMEHAEHELDASRVKLATYWGSFEPDFETAQAELFELPEVTSFDEMKNRLTNNPDLVRLATEARIAKTRVLLAKTRRSANFELSGGVRYWNDTEDTALMMSLTVPFGSSSRAQPEIEEMRLLAESQPLHYQQQQLALYASLYQTYQELIHARTEYEALTKTIIPQAKQAAADYRQGYQAGRFSLLEMNEAHATLLEARLEQVVAAANYHRLKIDIERLTGSTLARGE